MDDKGLRRPYFKPWTRVGLVTLTFAVLLVVQSIAAWTMHATASRGIRDALGTELETIGRSAASVIDGLATKHATPAELGSMLRRIREAHRLEDIVLLAGDGLILADPRGALSGTPSSVFACTPSVLRLSLSRRQPTQEHVRLLGTTYRRIYLPLEGPLRAVLCVTSYDAVPAGLQVLDQPLYVSLGLSLATALALALAVLVMLRLFEHAKARLIQTARLATVGTLAASIAHDVRNPLAIILSSTQVLRESRNLTNDQQALLADIEDEVRRADEQLDAFLDLSREIPLRTDRLDLGLVVGATVELLRFRAKQLGVELEWKLETGATQRPIMSRVDRRRLRQALLNVMMNALEASAQRPGARVSVSLERRPNSPGTAWIVVRDNGPGIPAPHLRHVFEPFFSTKMEGSGLGLKIAKQIIERHGGTVVLSSTVATGTVVEISLAAEPP